MNIIKASLILTAFTSLLFWVAPISASPIISSPIFAAPSKSKVYSWKDDRGVVHFSTSKSANPSAKAAKLPEINRGDVILTKSKLVSCSNHGGVNCQAGADDDGSVVCYDGFRGAASRYRFNCNAPRLKITEISDVDKLGNFTVMVRNAKSVAADLPSLLFKPAAGEEITLEGPEKIEPFGVAQFYFEPKDTDIPDGPITLAQLTVKCANCP